MSQRVEQRAYGLVERWREEFGNVMEAMADMRPVMELDAEAPEDSAGMLWWKQPFDIAAGAAFWIGAKPEAWQALGKQTLSAAGIDSVDTEEIKGTYLEVLRQSLGSLANALTAQAGKEVLCTEGAETSPDGQQGLGCRMSIQAGENKLPHLAIYLSQELLAATHKEAPQAAAASAPADEHPALSPRARDTLDLLLDVEMPVSVSFGRTQVRVQDVLKLITGSIIEMDRSISEPVEVIVNNCVIARGEVVVADGNYGVRISEVMSRKERLQESRKYLLPVSTSRH